MLIIMCGPPGSGKSTVADLFLEEIDADLIRPSDWMPDNIETLGGELEREYRIQCWRTAIEKTKELVITVSPEAELIGILNIQKIGHLIEDCGHIGVMYWHNLSLCDHLL